MKKLLLLLVVFAVAVSPTLAALQTTSIDKLHVKDFIDGEDTYKLTVGLKNTGSVTETGILEVAFFKPSNSFVNIQDACEPSFPWNVHKWYSVSPGETVSISLVAPLTGLEGTYNVVINHADACCNSVGGCLELEPYGFNNVIDTIVIGNPNANDADQCDNPFDAREYLESQGELSCAETSCVDAASSTSEAVCVVDGECRQGAKQAYNCPDGTVPDIRTCTDGEWVETGSVCAGSGVGSSGNLPPPPSVSESGAGFFSGFEFSNSLLV
jgi:hypothetical protein